MQHTEKAKVDKLHDLMVKIIKDPFYLELKDSFISTVPSGSRDSEIGVSVAHGMYLGTRFVFQEMERRVRGDQIVSAKKNYDGVDPDLAE